jgi:hypothetical protein
MDTLIAPVLALAAWTFIVGFWLFGARIAAMKQLRISPQHGAEVGKLNAMLPERARAIAANFNHLHEQPTLFYAVALSLQWLQAVNPLTLGLAWAYVGSRVLHSFVQNGSNHVPTRFRVFMVSSFILMGLLGAAIWALAAA